MRQRQGIDVRFANGSSAYFGVQHVRDAKHTLEYFWNRFRLANGLSVMPGSTHGRPLQTEFTLSGDVPASASALGNAVVETPGTAAENPTVKRHWTSIVVHQGWLKKKGGLDVDAAKSWVSCYFVLYATSQGHFLAYYNDVSDCPLYSQLDHNRNAIDLAKSNFIRPKYDKTDDVEEVALAFDIVTTEREWTVCAESEESGLTWLKLLTRCIDEDIAILPDEEVVFSVKAKQDPSKLLTQYSYGTTLRLSAFGVAVCSPDKRSGAEKQHFFWAYTDFSNWSLLSQRGKMALQITVFDDSSFTLAKSSVFIFRHKEAQRLAKAIEISIEKFMCVAHVSLELQVRSPVQSTSTAL